MRWNRTQGQSIVEYLIVVTALMVAFTTPLSALGDKSVVVAVIDAFKANHAAWVMSMSYPD